MTHWQPIETAPKDGTRVLLYIDEDEGPCIGKWDIDFWQKPNWCMEAGDYWSGATHWQPLPAPPPSRPTTNEGERG
jgi:hypothetical protein